MRLYFVRDKNGDYLYLKYGHLVFWGPKDEASIYHTREAARWMGQGAFNCDDDAEEHFDIVEIDTDAALEVLRDLFEDNLSGTISGILERTPFDWKTPLFAWGEIIRRAKELLKKSEQKHV